MIPEYSYSASTFLFSMDDVSVTDNQMLITTQNNISDNSLLSLAANLVAAGVTVRITTNRFSEPTISGVKLTNLLFSCVSVGVGNITAQNHGVYPILPIGNQNAYPDNQTTYNL